MSESEESVLCIPASNVARFCPANETRHVDANDFDVFDLTRHATWLPRSKCETDAKWRQLIPYIIVWRDAGILTYRRGRSGSEGRLHDLYSVGIGGHINEQPNYGPWDAVAVAARRELVEEIGKTAFIKTYCDGLLIDNTNNVGRVHVGVLMHASMDFGGIDAEVGVIKEPRFMLVPEAMKLNLETWSRIALDHLMRDALEGLE